MTVSELANIRVHGSCKGQTANQILNLGLQLNRTIFPVELCFWRCRTQKFLIIKYLLLFTRIFSHNSVTSWFKHSLVQYSKLPDVTLSNFEYAVAFQYSIQCIPSSTDTAILSKRNSSSQSGMIQSKACCLLLLMPIRQLPGFLHLYYPLHKFIKI